MLTRVSTHARDRQTRILARVASRRRVVARVGFLGILVTSAAACIFDSGSEYQGGGRRDTRITTTEETPTATAPANPNPTVPKDSGNDAETIPDTGGGTPDVDAG